MFAAAIQAEGPAQSLGNSNLSLEIHRHRYTVLNVIEAPGCRVGHGQDWGLDMANGRHSFSGDGG